MAVSKKPIKTIIKLQCPAGKATPAPPVGTALGPHGLNIMEFCTQFNEQTREKGDTIIPVEITVFEDRTFTFILKQPPAAILIKEALKLKSGSANPKKTKVGSLSAEQLRQIAETKMSDLSARTVEEAERIIAGTARSMGVDIEK
jgi:large subunit ribosomal protein L11